MSVIATLTVSHRQPVENTCTETLQNLCCQIKLCFIMVSSQQIHGISLKLSKCTIKSFCHLFVIIRFLLSVFFFFFFFFSFSFFFFFLPFSLFLYDCFYEIKQRKTFLMLVILKNYD